VSRSPTFSMCAASADHFLKPVGSYSVLLAAERRARTTPIDCGNT
jgi:hypothetical protein